MCLMHYKKKIDDKSEKCIHIGYNQVIEGYKLYNQQIKKAIVSCDVIFDKQVACDQSFNEKRPSSV